jgi:glycogen debranching enzyme
MSTAPSSAYTVDRLTPSTQGGITLLAGSTFVIAEADGSIRPGGAQGFYSEDTRLLSTFSITFDGQPPIPLAQDCLDCEMTMTGTVGDPTAPHLLVEQHWTLSDDLTMSVTLENLTAEPASVALDITVAADFSDLFEVKRGIRPRGGTVSHGAIDDDLVLRYQHRGFQRGVKIHVDRADEVLRDGVHIIEQLPGRGRQTVTITVTPLRTGHHHHFPTPTERQDWIDAAGPPPDQLPRHVWDRSWSDIGLLLMRDTMPPHPMVVAAGSPWFMALFGRDSLITGLETLPYRTDLAIGVLQALAARQGRSHDPVTLEQPGKIPHEARRGEVVQRPDGWGATFYGTVDATPLFVVTLCEAARRGAPEADVRDLLPAAERAIDWCLGPGDLDGDGFVEYAGSVHGAAGLANQGWKDSDDAVRHADGRLATGPISMVEVQGYVHAALRGLAELRDRYGTGDPTPLRERARTLANNIDAAFWMDDEDCYALALDGHDRPVKSVTSNAGHLLFTGTARVERAERLAARLMHSDMFSGYGMRTLSTRNPAYNPLSYHCGSVWPHDTALVAAGMTRYGCSEGTTLARALLDAAGPTGRLPELFGGFDRSRGGRPVPYPTSCAPQAWSAGAPLLLATPTSQPVEPHER